MDQKNHAKGPSEEGPEQELEDNKDSEKSISKQSKQYPYKNMDEVIISDYGLAPGVNAKNQEAKDRVMTFDAYSEQEPTRPKQPRNQISPALDGRVNLPASSVIGG